MSDNPTFDRINEEINETDVVLFISSGSSSVVPALFLASVDEVPISPDTTFIRLPADAKIFCFRRIALRSAAERDCTIEDESDMWMTRRLFEIEPQSTVAG